MNDSTNTNADAFDTRTTATFAGMTDAALMTQRGVVVGGRTLTLLNAELRRRGMATSDGAAWTGPGHHRRIPGGAR